MLPSSELSMPVVVTERTSPTSGGQAFRQAPPHLEADGLAESRSNRYSVRPSGPTTTGPSRVWVTSRVGLPAPGLAAELPVVFATALLADPGAGGSLAQPERVTRATTAPAQIVGTRFERSFTGVPLVRAAEIVRQQRSGQQRSGNEACGVGP